jgi:hypothetical protein
LEPAGAPSRAPGSAQNRQLRGLFELFDETARPEADAWSSAPTFAGNACGG